ncbi:hypothetical protein [Stenotrophomonas rhizophila]
MELGAQPGLLELLRQAIQTQRVRRDPAGQHVYYAAGAVAQLQSCGGIIDETVER